MISLTLPITPAVDNCLVLIAECVGVAMSRRAERSFSASETIARLDVRSLLMNAAASTVRQTIDVERLEDEIVMGPQPEPSQPAYSSGVGLGDSMGADYNTVSEQARQKHSFTCRVVWY